MGDVGHHALTQGFLPFQAFGHPVEGRGQLTHLVLALDRDPGLQVPLGDALHPGLEPAQGTQDAQGEQAAHQQGDEPGHPRGQQDRPPHLGQEALLRGPQDRARGHQQGHHLSLLVPDRDASGQDLRIHRFSGPGQGFAALRIHQQKAARRSWTECPGTTGPEGRSRRFAPSSSRAGRARKLGQLLLDRVPGAGAAVEERGLSGQLHQTLLGGCPQVALGGLGCAPLHEDAGHSQGHQDDDGHADEDLGDQVHARLAVPRAIRIAIGRAQPQSGGTVEQRNQLSVALSVVRHPFRRYPTPKTVSMSWGW